jgi:hypothetical protein
MGLRTEHGRVVVEPDDGLTEVDVALILAHKQHVIAFLQAESVAAASSDQSPQAVDPEDLAADASALPPVQIPVLAGERDLAPVIKPRGTEAPSATATPPQCAAVRAQRPRDAPPGAGVAMDSDSPPTKARGKRQRGIQVDRLGAMVCHRCEQKGQVAHHLSLAFWRPWSADYLATVLGQLQLGERLAGIGYRLIKLEATDHAKRELYESGVGWSALPQLNTVLDNAESDPITTVIVGPLPDIPRSKNKGKRGFLTNLAGDVACLRCGEKGQHDLVLIFYTFWDRERLSALVRAMRSGEHLLWVEHTQIKLQAPDGTARILHQRDGEWREIAAVNATAAPHNKSVWTPQDVENLIATARTRCAHWYEQAPPELRPHLDTLIEESDRIVAERLAQQDFDGLRDYLIDLQRRIGEAMETK